MARHQDVDVINAALSRLLRLSASRRAYARSADAAGVALSQPGFVLLNALREKGPLPMGELARIAHMDPATAARQVARLDQSGMVTRAPSKQDARVTVVRATARGARAATRLSEVRSRHLVTSLADWSAGDSHTFAQLLDRFVGALAGHDYPRAE